MIFNSRIAYIANNLEFSSSLIFVYLFHFIYYVYLFIHLFIYLFICVWGWGVIQCLLAYLWAFTWGQMYGVLIFRVKMYINHKKEIIWLKTASEFYLLTSSLESWAKEPKLFYESYNFIKNAFNIAHYSFCIG